MSRATESALARVPMSWGWSKSSAPAQTRQTPRVYSVVGSADAACPGGATSAAAASAEPTRTENERIGSHGGTEPLHRCSIAAQLGAGSRLAAVGSWFVL